MRRRPYILLGSPRELEERKGVNTGKFDFLLINVGLVGVPPWLPFLHWLHFAFDLGYLIGNHPIPLLKIFGGIATYQANIHI